MNFCSILIKIEINKMLLAKDQNRSYFLITSWTTIQQITHPHIIQIMLQDRLVVPFAQDYDELNQELKQFRKINFSLRKKIKEKDHRIQQLFGYIQDASRVYGHSPEHPLIKSQPPLERHPKLTLSDNRKKEKENKHTQLYDENNIFKQPSHHAIGRISKEELHLPSLDKKSKNIFSLEQQIDNPQKKGRMVRIPIERLKPLDSQQVRKRFLLKYSRVQGLNE